MFQNKHAIPEVVTDGQIVLDNDNEVLFLCKLADGESGSETLLHVEVGAGLVEHVHVGLL